MTSGIYKITNLVNNKVYIGSALNLERRKTRHFSDLRKNKHCNKYFQRAYNKYGLESFKWEILCICDAEFLIGNEQEFIDDYSKILGFKNLYNICQTAGSPLGLKRSAETKRKMSLALKGQTRSDEARKNISEAKKGEKNPCWGKFGAEHHYSKPVEAVCVTTGKTTLFGSAREAKKQWTGVDNRNISACCLGKRKTHAKHYWRFA